MKKIFIVDEDNRFQASVKSVCRVGTVDLRVYTSSMEVLPLIAKEQPALIFVNLELPDINDFVMYDLLKKADTKPPIPVIVTYAEQSEKELDKYQKLKFKPDGFYKKAISENDIKALVVKHLGNDLMGGKTDRKQKETAQETTKPEESPLDEDDLIFTEVIGETGDVMESFLDENGKDSPLADIVKDNGDGKPKEAVFSVSEGPSVDIMEKTKHRELAARLMSMEKQNHFLRTENNRMNDEVERLKSEIKKLKEGKPLEQTAAEIKESGEAVGNDFEQQVIRLKGENADLLNRINDLSDKLTDKQREMIARDHEFEKRLKNEADKLIHETEDRLMTGAREKEERLRADVARLENEKMRRENAHKDELHRQDSQHDELRKEIDALKNTETNLNAVIASMEEEKQSLSQLLESHKEKINAIEEGKETVVQQLKCSEEDLANAVKEKEKIEKNLSASIDNLTRELESARKELESRVEKVDEYRNRLDGLGKLLQQALMLSEEGSEKE